MKKTLITILATVLVCACLVGGTLAWLTDSTSTIENTFTIGDINITLVETKGTLVDGKKTFKMVPGSDIEKDPKVSVATGSESCWLFVKVEEENNKFGEEKYITYTPAAGWTELGTGTGVYWRVVNADDETRDFSVFDGDKVSVNSKITKTQATALNEENAELPTLKVTAYAVQHENIANAETAWAQFKTNP